MRNKELLEKNFGKREKDLGRINTFVKSMQKSEKGDEKRYKLDNTPEFLDYCSKSNGLVFFGSIGSGKTAILAMLAQELPGENKHATFPCNLP